MTRKPVVRLRKGETYPQMYKRQRVAWAEYRDLKAMDHFTRWAIDVKRMHPNRRRVERKKLNFCRAYHELRLLDIVL